MKKGNGNGGDAEVWRRYSAGQWCSTGHVEASVALPVLLVEANSSVRCRAPGLLPSSAHPLAAWQQGGSYLPWPLAAHLFSGDVVAFDFVARPL